MPFFSNKLSVLLLVIVVGILIWNHNRAPDHTPTQEAQRPVPKVEAPSPSQQETAPAALVETQASQVPPTTAIPVIPTPARTNEAPTAALLPPGSATEPPAASFDISEDLSAVDSAIRNFQAALGENPIGSNAEITGALLGNNLKQIKLEIPAGSQLDGEGQMCDRWGSPYFFHQISGTEMEIRSAGPDRVMWTGDDATL
jgi:hypothetical protein